MFRLSKGVILPVDSSSLRRFWGKLKRHMPRAHGNRGMTMLGFALVAFGFGTAYTWPGVLPPEVLEAPGTRLASMFLPLQVWGAVWYIAGVTLISNAFKVEQSKAMGIITSLFSVWSLSHLYGFFLTAIAGKPNTGWLVSLIYLGLVVACLGIARSPNPGAVHKELVDAPGEAAQSKLFGETGEIPLTTRHGDD